MELYKLAESCNYGDMETEMIRDRLVVGKRDIVLFRHLQLDADLTLETAKKNLPERGNRRTATGPKRDKWRLHNFAASSCPARQEYIARIGRRYCKPVCNGNPRGKTKPCTRCGKGVQPDLC